MVNESWLPPREFLLHLPNRKIEAIENLYEQWQKKDFHTTPLPEVPWSLLNQVACNSLQVYQHDQLKYYSMAEYEQKYEKTYSSDPLMFFLDAVHQESKAIVVPENFDGKQSLVISCAPHDFSLAIQKIHIRLEPDARMACIIECSQVSAYVLRAFSFDLQPNSQLSIEYRTQCTEKASILNAISLRIAQSAQVHFLGISSDTKTHYLSCTAYLCGEHALFKATHAHAASAEQHNTIDMRIVHESQNTKSGFYCASVVDHCAHVNMQSAVTIVQNAKFVDARQVLRALLLSEQARANARPTLQVNAHQVQCAHGTTISTLDAEALWYLCSRGIDSTTARNILIQAFVKDILTKDSFLKELSPSLVESYMLPLLKNSRKISLRKSGV